jgi:hypothetical protein
MLEEWVATCPPDLLHDGWLPEVQAQGHLEGLLEGQVAHDLWSSLRSRVPLPAYNLLAAWLRIAHRAGCLDTSCTPVPAMTALTTAVVAAAGARNVLLLQLYAGRFAAGDVIRTLLEDGRVADAAHIMEHLRSAGGVDGSYDLRARLRHEAHAAQEFAECAARNATRAVPVESLFSRLQV